MDDALSFIRISEATPNETTWTTMLGAARCQQHLHHAKQAAEEVIRLSPNPNAVSVRVLLSKVYASIGRWDVGRVWKDMKKRGLKKQPGVSRIEVDGTVHKFMDS